jgi:hypothetical protein
MTRTKSQDTISPRDTSATTIVIKQRGSTADVLYRFISTLDADIHITLEGTDTIDGESFAEAETLPIGGGSGDPDADTKLVTDGSSTTQVESTLLSEGWPWLRFTITAQTTPTAGSVELRDVTNV